MKTVIRTTDVDTVDTTVGCVAQLAERQSSRRTDPVLRSCARPAADG